MPHKEKRNRWSRMANASDRQPQENWPRGNKVPRVIRGTHPSRLHAHPKGGRLCLWLATRPGKSSSAEVLMTKPDVSLAAVIGVAHQSHGGRQRRDDPRRGG